MPETTNTIMAELTRFGTKIPLQSLTPTQLQAHLDTLTVSPIQTEFNKFTRIHYKLYLQTQNHLYVPRFYCSGSPSLSKELHSKIHTHQLAFRGVLRDTTCQPQASAQVTQHLYQHGGCILSLPTGFGKTTVALHVLCTLQVKTLIVVHKEFLLHQWCEKIRQFIPEATIGRIQGPWLDIENTPIVLGMLQSLSMKTYAKDTFDTFGLTIIDEAHHICTQTYSQFFQKCNTKYVLGLSATLHRTDGLTRVLHWYMGGIGYETVRKNQSHVQVLVLRFDHPTYHRPFPQTKGGAINLPQSLTQLIDLPERNELILQHVRACHQQGRKTIVLTDRRKHCEDLFEMCTSQAIVAGLYLGGMKPHELKESEDKYVIIGTYTLAHEGLDIPALDTILLSTPKANIVQAVGRILRENPNAQHQHTPLIIDLVDQWGPFYHQYRKRREYYRTTGFQIQDSNEPNADVDTAFVPEA